MENGMLEIARRDTSEKKLIPLAEAGEYIYQTLEDIQKSLL